MRHVFIGTFRKAGPVVANALAGLVAMIDGLGGGLDGPQICVIKSPTEIKTPEGWRQIVSDIAGSGIADADEIASYLSSNQPDKLID
jgi:hypothetical protein